MRGGLVVPIPISKILLAVLHTAISSKVSLSVPNAFIAHRLTVVIDSDTHLTWKCLPDKLWCCNTGVVGPAIDRANKTNLTCCDDNDLLFTAENPVVFTTAWPYNSMFSIGTALPIPTSVSNTTISPASATSASTSPGLSSTTSVTSDLPAPSSGTSTLAIGLGAGIGSAAAIALGIVSFIMLRRRKRTDAESPGSGTPTEELASEGVVEGNNEHVVEITAHDKKAELASPDSAFELWSPVVSAELPCEEKGRCNVNELDGSQKN